MNDTSMSMETGMSDKISELQFFEDLIVVQIGEISDLFYTLDLWSNLFYNLIF